MTPSRPLPAFLCLMALALSLASVASLGCRGEPPPPPPEPQLLPADQIVPATQRELRRDLGREVRVGYVAEVLPQRTVVGITNIDATGIRPGMQFLLFSQDRQPVAWGTVFSVTEDGIFADYTIGVVTGGREPRVGDLAGFGLRQ